MANFEGTVPTKQGLVLIGKVGTGVPLNFTRVAVGSGVWSPEQVAKPAAMTGLIKEEMTLAISPESIKVKEEPEGDEPVGCYSMRVMLTNSGLASGFALREIGIYATDPDLGEILYAVDYAGDLYDYIPALPANAAPLEKIFNLDFLTGTAKEVFVNQSPVLLATVDDIGDHNTDPEAHPDLLDRLATGIPEILTPADGDEVGETPFFTFRPFVATIANTIEEALQLQVDLLSGNFSSPVHDTGWLTTIPEGYELPSALLIAGQNIYKSRVRRRLKNGLISPWSNIVSMTTKMVFDYVDRASNVSPGSGATGVLECPTFVGSAFSVTGDVADTHDATRGFILKDGVVLYETGDLGPVTEFTPPPGYHQVSEYYEWQIQYKGAILGWGEKSAPTGYHTAAAFITGDEALSFSSWDGYDNASSVGVALADDASLRSSGVDQGELEGDWVSYKTRAKVRGERLPLDASTSASHIFTRSKVTEGQDIITEQGKVTAGAVVKNDIDPLTGEYTFEGSSLDAVTDGNDITYAEMSTGAGLSNSLTFKFIFPEALSFTRFAAKVDNSTNMNLSIWSNGQQVTNDYTVNGNIIEKLIPDGIELQEVLLSVGMYESYSSRRVLEVYLESSLYQIDISAAGLAAAPSVAAIMPTMIAATGPAGTAFTAADFNEIDVQTATLGTDTDTDRPDFILLESAKITPAESFRRVALGVSGLSKDSETRIAETQCDTWKEGA